MQAEQHFLSAFWLTLCSVNMELRYVFVETLTMNTENRDLRPKFSTNGLHVKKPVGPDIE